MSARRGLCLAAAFALACVGLAGESAAAQPAKIDLTDNFDGFPHIGDFRVYNRSDGQTLRTEILDLREHKKSTEYETEYDEAGDLEQDFSETVHGKENRVASVISGDVVFATARPKRVQSFLVVLGKPQKFKVGFAVFYQGRRAGKATLAGTSTFVGFEPWMIPPLDPYTPPATLQSAHMHREQTFTIKVGHSVFKSVSTSNAWITLERGTVLIDRVTQSYQDGVLQETIGFVYAFDHGLYQGVPYP